VRVLAVAHVLQLAELQAEDVGVGSALVLLAKTGQIVRDGAVVAGRVREHLFRQREARCVGDAAAGAKINAQCIGCHGIPGYQSSFPEVHKVPMISGQNAKYIGAALNAYKRGERKHPTMYAVAAGLSEQNIADLSAYYAAHGAGAPAPETAAVQPTPEVAALLAKGACVSCHGANFSKPIDGSYPKIAGQYPDYLFKALNDYHKGLRKNPIMGAIAKPLTKADMQNLAAYYGSLPGPLTHRR